MCLDEFYEPLSLRKNRITINPERFWGDSLESVLKIRGGGHFKVDNFSHLTSSKIGTNYVNIRPKLI